MAAIETHDLTVRFGSVTALREVSLKIEPGRIVGLLGRNGAGKTTLLNVLSDRLFPAAGQALLFDEPARENPAAQARLYYAAEKRLFPENLTLREVMAWTGQFYSEFDGEYAVALAQKFQLNTAQRVKGLSTGNSSILKLILALASGAELLLLDEPVLGLDANNRALFYRELIERMASRPVTCVLSTHLIDEAADVLEDAILLHQGRVLAHDSVESLRTCAYAVSGGAQAVERFLQGRRVLDVQALGGLRTAAIGAPADDAARRQAGELGLEISPVSLQSLFVSMTGQ